MRIKMIKGSFGYPDGIHPQEYKADQTYEIPEPLAQNFLGQGIAEKALDEPETKAEGPAPANKAETQAPANKAEETAPAAKDEEKPVPTRTANREKARK